MSYLKPIKTIGVFLFVTVLSTSTYAGRYDGIAKVFNEAASATSAVKKADAPHAPTQPSGQLTNDFNRAANPPPNQGAPQANYNYPGGPVNNGPRF